MYIKGEKGIKQVFSLCEQQNDPKQPRSQKIHQKISGLRKTSSFDQLEEVIENILNFFQKTLSK